MVELAYPMAFPVVVLAAVLVGSASFGRRFNKRALFAVSYAQLTRRLAFQMTCGFLVSACPLACMVSLCPTAAAIQEALTKVAWPLVAGLVRSSTIGTLR